MTNILGFTPAEVSGIFEMAGEVDAQVDAIQAHVNQTGTVIPMRTLGWGEENILYQRHLIAREQFERAAGLMSAWTTEHQD